MSSTLPLCHAPWRAQALQRKRMTGAGIDHGNAVIDCGQKRATDTLPRKKPVDTKRSRAVLIQFAMHEFDDLLDRVACLRRMRVVSDECFAHGLEQV
jgi:hypothetical protein